jgi:hypothetical protein
MAEEVWPLPPLFGSPEKPKGEHEAAEKLCTADCTAERFRVFPSP